jgi:amino acid transporter
MSFTEKEYDAKHSKPASVDEAVGDFIEINEDTTTKPQRYDGFLDSFSAADDVSLGIDPTLPEIDKLAIRTKKHPVLINKSYAKILSVAGWMGTGFLLVSGIPLRVAGPVGMLISVIAMGTLVQTSVQAIGELSVSYPNSGAFIRYGSQFVCPSWGFSMAWNYALTYLVMFPLELYASSIIIQHWDQKTNPAIYILVLYVAMVFFCMFGFKGYSEWELFLGLIKIIAVVGFIILAIVIICGGAPEGGYIGAKYWHSPGVFAHSFKGFCFSFSTVAFIFARAELAGVYGAASPNPRKRLPKAIKQIFWRTILIYIVPFLLFSFIVRFDDKGLLGAKSLKASNSAFVLAINYGGVKGLPSVFNAVCLISIFNLGIQSISMSANNLAQMGASGYAPKYFSYIDKAGRPIVGIIVQCIFGTLGFSRANKFGDEVVDYCLFTSGATSIFTWMAVNVALIRFRRALSVQGRKVSDLPYVSKFGVLGAIYGSVIGFLMLFAYFWSCLFPIGGKPTPKVFFKFALIFLINFVTYVGHRIWTGNYKLFIRAKDIDLDAGKKEVDLDYIKQEIEFEKERDSQMPVYKKLYYFWC